MPSALFGPIVILELPCLRVSLAAEAPIQQRIHPRGSNLCDEVSLQRQVAAQMDFKRVRHLLLRQRMFVIYGKPARVLPECPCTGRTAP